MIATRTGLSTGAFGPNGDSTAPTTSSAIRITVFGTLSTVAAGCTEVPVTAASGSTAVAETSATVNGVAAAAGSAVRLCAPIGFGVFSDATGTPLCSGPAPIDAMVGWR